MGAVGFTALAANAATFGLVWAYRGSDANMRSAWICTRNDVMGNLAVLLAALGVFGTGTGSPDFIIAAIMASLALQAHGAAKRSAPHRRSGRETEQGENRITPILSNFRTLHKFCRLVRR
jgi:Co/Zn/Cd efflux system component